MDDAGSTLTPVIALRRRGPGPDPFLFLVLQCDRPRAGGLRLRLADFDEVVIGRGNARSWSAIDGSGGKVLQLSLPDAWMSRTHARLIRTSGHWLLEDKGSKNGTFLNGEQVTQAALGDGDLIELGQSFFLFRPALAGASSGPFAFDTAQLAGRARSFATLLPSLESELRQAEAIAASSIEVLILGETGTGKEVLARDLHALSRRRGPFVPLNCGAIPAQLVESELFGHCKGAFSGADEDRPGLFRSADGGTLLLDEVGELPGPAQAALLRVLQDGEVRPVGGTRPVKVDVRVLAATNRDVDRRVAEGAFRPDLLARLSGFRISLPPLRDRREDLGILAAAMLEEGVTLEIDAARALLQHEWTLNMRELEKALRAASVLARGRPIAAADLRTLARAAAPEADPLREELVRLLREHRGNVSAVARAMDKARMQVQRWMLRYRLDAEDFRR